MADYNKNQTMSRLDRTRWDSLRESLRGRNTYGKGVNPSNERGPSGTGVTTKPGYETPVTPMPVLEPKVASVTPYPLQTGVTPSAVPYQQPLGTAPYAAQNELAPSAVPYQQTPAAQQTSGQGLYSYDDFERAANAAGLLGNFSQYDLDLARRYPEAGLSLLSLKQDWNNATTDEQRVLANEAANQIRSSYGYYTGGADGSGYQATPGAKYGTQIDDVLGKIGSFGSFDYADAPTYTNPYAQQQQALLNALLSHGDFSWSKEEDPLWGSYKKSYLREGDRATANALAQAAAATGGRPSSYAVGAATQAGDYYATKLNDIIPTLYQQAYERYLQDYQRKLSDLGAVNQQQQLDYARYLDELGQFNTDRSQAYNQYLDQYSMLQAYMNALQGQDETAYTRAWNEAQTARQWQQQEWENQFELALQAAAYGDYSGLAALGITPNNENVLANTLAAAGRTVPVGSGGTGGGTGGTGGTGGSGNGGTGGTGGIDAGLAAQLAQLYPDGNVTNADDWNYLLSLYDEATLAAAGYHYGAANQQTNTPNGNPTAADLQGADIDMTSVLNLGYGPISEARLSELIDSGEVEMYVENGKIRFRRTGRGGTRTGYLGFLDSVLPTLP